MFSGTEGGAQLIQAEIDQFFRKCDLLTKRIIERRQGILGNAAMHFVLRANGAAPRSKRPHYRYATSKLTKKLRAPKGMGKKVATYMPGNLALSIRVLKFRRAQSKVYVGAKLSKGSSPKGTFGVGNRADGYYLHMVERTHPFFIPAWERSRDKVYKSIVEQLRALAAQFEKENKI